MNINKIQLNEKRFQFLGIPPKGEPSWAVACELDDEEGFQFLGIPPKGEHIARILAKVSRTEVSNF